MTKILHENMEIECPLCKQKHIMTIYNSVNVQVNPELKEKVFNREINIFPCNKGKGYLWGQFLYVDDDHWIWLYPDFFAEKKEELENQISEQQQNLEKMLGNKSPKIYLVFGYDEFFKLIKKIDNQG